MSDRKTEIEQLLAWWRRRVSHGAPVMALALAVTAGCGVDDPVDATPDGETPTMDGALEELERGVGELPAVELTEEALVDLELTEAAWGTAIPLLPEAGARGVPPTTIVGGTPVTSSTKYPFMTYLTISGPSGSGSCGATLVAPQWVMTAAHCVTDTSRTGTSLPSELTAYIGGIDLAAFTGEVRSVSQVIVHPWYNTQAGAYDNDVALLRLTSNSTRTPVDLATPYAPGDRQLWKPGAAATAIGYGRTCDTCGTSSKLLEVTLPIVADSSMSTYYGSSFNSKVHVGAGYTTPGKSICFGDSGGPLLVPSNNGYQEVGVSSWVSPGCSSSTPPVFARVGAMSLSRWIKTVIHETPVVGDVNGDGRDDIVTCTHGDSSSGPLDVYVALSNGSSFGASSKWQDWWAHRGHICALGDFNGDGKEDLFAFTESQVWVAISRGYDFNGPIYASPVGSVEIDDLPFTGDVNGDGRADMVLFEGDATGDVDVILSTGAGFGSRAKWHDWFAPEGETPAVCRINSDSRADLVTFTQLAGDSDAYVAQSTGSSFSAGYKAHNWFGLASEVPLCGNFNGDSSRLGDIVTFTRNAAQDVWVALGNGSTFGTSYKWQATFGDGNDTLLVGDVTGDGKDDALRFTQDAAADVFVARSTGSSFAAPTLWHGYFAP